MMMKKKEEDIVGCKSEIFYLDVKRRADTNKHSFIHIRRFGSDQDSTQRILLPTEIIITLARTHTRTLAHIHTKQTNKMAHYGIQAQVAAKTASKRSPGIEKAVLEWIFSVIEEKQPEGITYEETLKDGVVLCKLMNKIKPGSIDKIATSGSGYLLMENINKFIKVAQDYGVPHTQLFRTVDLFEKKNIPEVTAGIIAFARQVGSDSNFKGPQLDKWVFAQ